MIETSCGLEDGRNIEKASEEGVIDGVASTSDASPVTSQTNIKGEASGNCEMTQDDGEHNSDPGSPSRYVIVDSVDETEKPAANEAGQERTEEGKPTDADIGECEDDIESLLASYVSKDYINCVWSNVPVSPNSGGLPSTSHQQNKKENTPEISPLKEDVNKSVGKKQRKPKKNSKVKTNDKVPVKKIPMKTKDKLKLESEGNTITPNVKKKTTKGKPRTKLSKVMESKGEVDPSTAEDKLEEMEVDCSITPKVNSSLQLELTKVSSSFVQSSPSHLQQSNKSSNQTKQLKVFRRLEPVDPNKFTKSPDPSKSAAQRDPNKLVLPGRAAQSTNTADPVHIIETMDDAMVIKSEDMRSVGESVKMAIHSLSVRLAQIVPPYSPNDLDQRFFDGKFFICNACGDKYVLQTSLLAHKSRKSARFIYKCSICELHLTFDNRCSVLSHAMSHGIQTEDMKSEDLTILPLNGDENGIDSLFKNSSLTFVECPECKRSVSSLKCHLEGKDTLVAKSKWQSDSVWTCDVCECILPSSCSLAAHRRYHNRQPPHFCPDCGEVFLKSSALLAHMEETCFHHLRGAMYQCGFCKSFHASKFLFREHLLTKHLKIFYSCDICGLPASGVHGFNVHRNIMHELPDISEGSDAAEALCTRVHCDICPGIVINKNSLEEHAIMHSSDPKVIRRMYQCNECGSILSSKELVKIHKATSCRSNSMSECTGIMDENAPKECFISESAPTQHQSLASLKEEKIDIHEIPPTNSAVTKKCDYSEEVLGSKERKNSLRNSSLRNARLQEKSCETTAKKDDDVDNMNRLQELKVEKPAIWNASRKNILCKLCRKVVSEGVDKAAIKRHFATHHFSIFMKAVYGKGNEHLPTQIVYTGNKEQVHKASTSNIDGIFPKKSKEGKNSSGFRASETKPKFKKRLKKRESKGENSVKVRPPNPNLQDSKDKSLKCYKCQFTSQNSFTFKKHITTHKSNPSDLQCPECGLCFIVRPPLVKHLIALHFIENVDKYLEDHGFEEHFSEEEEIVEVVAEPEVEELQENQCKVCRKKFDSALLLEKHFRVHGGAFLLAKLKANRASQ